MTRIPRIGMILLYVTVTIGVTIATHYCAGKAMEADLLAGNEQAPSCPCGMESPIDDCCNTTVSTLRVSDDHTVVASWVAPPFAGTLIAEPLALPVPLAPVVVSANEFHPPGPSRRILICSLLV